MISSLTFAGSTVNTAFAGCSLPSLFALERLREKPRTDDYDY
jgi:hypothetical protein